MYNKVILIGRLTAMPELKRTQSGTSVTSFTLAVDRQYSSGGERQTDFINCVAWRQTAEFICKYFNKGSLFGVDGELQMRSYTDRSENKRTVAEVMVNNAFFTESKKATDNSKNKAPVAGEETFEEITTEDDLPF